MFEKNAFQVEGVVTRVLTQRTARVRLENGHELLGFLTGKSQSAIKLESGCRVKLQLSPYDLSEGRVIEKQEII
jgi:translation initiation factor IF-1